MGSPPSTEGLLVGLILGGGEGIALDRLVPGSSSIPRALVGRGGPVGLASESPFGWIGERRSVSNTAANDHTDK